MPSVDGVGPPVVIHSRGLLRQLFLRGAIFTSFTIAAAFCLPTPAWAWGCEGHQVIALLAEKRLTPHALATVKGILSANIIDPSLSRYCKEGGIDAMADAATWADDYRSQHSETGPWHYIDIPLGTLIRNIAKDVEQFCDPKKGCVTQAITQELSILRSPQSDPQKRAEALRFLIHFVGDLHQPLHATTNNDQGGNCVPVAFFDALSQLRNPQTESYAPNLHAVWDVNILARATHGETVDQVATDLDQSFRRKIIHWEKGPANIDAWAAEGYQLASKNVYGMLPVNIAVESPQPIASCADDNHISARMLKLNEQLGEPYQVMAVPVVRQRLAQAGARLAMLLNRLWP
jgi:hypothetical protein